MEYSFVHFAGTLWASDGPRGPDQTLWHATLPMHPKDPDAPVVLTSSTGTTTTIKAFDLATTLLQQQPVARDDDPANGRSVSSLAQRADEDVFALARRRPGSVAALTTGLRPLVESEDTSVVARSALERLIASFETTGWVEISHDPNLRLPWKLRALEPPEGFNQKPKTYAKEATAVRNMPLLLEELKVARAAELLRLPRLQVKKRREGQRLFTIPDLLLLAAALGLPPTALVAQQS